ncbi:TipJ family phage tail tip protein [Pseudomonas sp. UBA6562]|uniref:TipJ family phage tail tip protein n=1 Tax=Pseudomonas sp. UBA6562 TaxID=1947332 RepID=UPI0025D72228|nr:DUF1983 domain-containing protein [Pseudomonas sp. UBA6562]
MTDLSIQGSKGGSKQHTPVESPDSLINISYANILDGISEGPIVGLVNGAQSIYLDKTPLANSDGSLNFTGVTWEQRTGEHDQDHISGFPAVESQASVGVELKASQPWVQSFSNLELSAVRVQLGVGALVVTEQDGDRVGYRVAYEIDLSTDDSDYKVVHSGAFDGKTTTGYQRSVRIDLPEATRGWRLRVRRTTPDSTTSNTQASTSVGTYTEIIDAKLQYPYTALCGLKIDASQFSAIPERAYRIRGRIIQVPSNYTPATRAYSGTWDGTFKLAWTDCPAWIWRDIVLNDRYGLGRFIDSSQIDKWALYQIAQYCDQMVSDGKGGHEPRFTCNVYLQSRADALTVLQDLASVFRGMSFYASSQVACAADMPGDPVYTYTNANVLDGKFSRAGSSGSTRFSVAKVAWSDRENFGNQRVEYVQDQKSLARYGVRETEVTAFGCVSQGQAQRAGQYILLTNRLETGTITFSVGLDGTICRPGDVIRVADEHYAGAPLAGRIKAATASTVTLDTDIKVAAGDTLVVILPKGVAETRVVQSVAGRVVTVTQAFSAVPVKESVYTIETSELVAETYRVLTVNENFGDDKLQYDVVAIARNNSKFAAIDDGAQIIIPPTSVLPAAVQAPPTNVKLSTFDTLNQGINIATMRITWDASRGAQSYRVWWKRNNGDWIYAGVTYTAALEVRGIYSGTYTARVSAEGVAGNSSIWALSEPTALFGKTGEPPAITSLTTESLLFGIGLKWTFPPGAEDTQRTELWYSAGSVLADATKLADLAYPQDKHTLQGLRAGQRFYFWARLVDRSGNVGPWFPSGTTLVTGQASADAGPILEQIKDQITESELGKELTSKIEKIALIDGNGPGSVNERLGTAKTELAKQISDVNNALGATKSNLQQQITAVSADVSAAKTDLQQQIANVSALSGSLPYRKDKTYTTSQSALGADGKLYQATKAVPLNTPPPNADYWTDVGQAVVTANGVAARVSKVETDVSTLDGKATAQASQLSGLQTSLTTTNGNVTAAQNAADAANALAGGKGKVIIQAAAPATADRLAQNLWIDTTGNANTPKRWNGSAWVAVTDKAATDAAAAAQSALALAQTKADASVVSSISTRVTDAEGKLSSQATKLDGMQTSIDGKASSQALQQVTSRVTATEQKDAAQDQQLTSQSQALTSLKDSVDKKADSSAVQSLSNEVKQQGQTLTSQGQSLVSINSTIGQLGGENWIYNPSFEKSGSGGLADGWARAGASGVTANPSIVPSALATGEFAQRIDVTGVSASAWGRIGNLANRRVKVSPGAAVTLSAYMRGTAGLNVRCEIQFLNAAGSSISGVPVAANTLATADYARLSHSVVAPQGTVECNFFVTCYGTAAISSAFLEVDRCQLEFSPSVSGWRDNGAVNADAATAVASAVQSLSGRVDQTESSLTSQSGAITQLTNSLNTTNQEVGKKADASTVQSLGNTVSQQGTAISANGRALTNISASLSNLGASGVNLVPAEYCAFAKDLPANMYSNGGVAMSTVADAAAFKGYALKAANSNVDSHTFGLNNGFTAAGCNMGFKSGKYLVSFYARAEVAGHVVGVYARVLLADGSSFKTSNAPTFTLTTAWARYVGVIDLTDPAYTGTQMQLAVQSNRSGVANRVTYYDRFMFEAAVNDQVEPSTFSMGNSFDQSAVLAEATTALSGRVGKNEEGLTSTSSQLTQLKNSIGGSGVNLLPAEYSTFQKTLPAIDGSSYVASLDSDAATFSGAALKFTWSSDSVALAAFLAASRNVGNMGMKPQKFIISYRARASVAGHVVALYLRSINTDGSASNSPAATQQALTTAWARYSYVADLSGGGFTGDKMLLALQMNRSGVSGRSVWFDQIMVEQMVGDGAAPSTFVPGNTADQASAASSAIDSLNSSVTQQGKDLTSVTGRTTLLEGSVNSTSSGLATKASTSALQTLTGRVTATEGGLTAANSSITRIGSQVGAIGGTGSNLVPAEYSTFTDTLPAFRAQGGLSITAQADSSAYSSSLLKVDSSTGSGWMWLAGSPSDFNLRLVAGRQYIVSFWARGSAAHVVAVRLRYQNTAGGETEIAAANVNVATDMARLSLTFTAPAALAGPACIVLFTQSAGNAGITWFDGFMVEEKIGEATAPSAFTPGTSTRQAAGQALAVSALDTKVTQQGAKIESEAKRTDGLYTSVGNANSAIQSEASTRSSADTALGRRIDTVQSNVGNATASIQSEAQTRADADSALGRRVDDTQASLGNTNAFVQQVSTAQVGLDNKVNASYSVRLQVVNGNQYVAAGFGAGIENNGGVLQSTFAVMADRFAVLNPSGNGFVNPFAIQNGQVFINDAFISKLAVQNAMVGSSIQSSSMTSYGVPIMSADFVSGQITARDPSSSSTYSFMNRNGLVVVIDGAIRVRMGKW